MNENERKAQEAREKAVKIRQTGRVYLSIGLTIAAIGVWQIFEGDVTSAVVAFLVASNWVVGWLAMKGFVLFYQMGELIHDYWAAEDRAIIEEDAS